MSDISSLFESAEETTEPETVSFNGTIPPWLKGSFIQIGPGKLDLSPNYSLKDYLDGYGILTKFSFSPTKGSVTLSKKFVETESLKKAVDTGLPQFTEFGTIASAYGNDKGLLSKMVSSIGSMMKDDMSDNCSASLYQIGDKLCGASATSFFFELDSKTLKTVRKYDGKKYFGQNGLGVHPLIDSDGTMWNMGFSILPTFKYNIIKIPNASKSNQDLDKLFQGAKTICSISSRWTGAFAFNHSFGMSQNHIIFIEQPYLIKISRVLSSKLKGYAVKDWLEWKPQDKNRFYIVEKNTGHCLNVEITSEDSFFFLHFVNCYEEDDNLIIDLATSSNPSATEATTLSKLRNNEVEKNVEISKIQRFIVPLKKIKDFKNLPENGNLLQDFSSFKGLAYRKGGKLIVRGEDLTENGIDRLNICEDFRARKCKFLYGAGSFLSSDEVGPFAHSVCKVDLDTKKIQRWYKSPQYFPGEPIFVGYKKSGSEEEDKGVVISAIETIPELKGASAKDNFVVILDPKTMEELGRAEFKTRFNGGLHGIFIKDDE